MDRLLLSIRLGLAALLLAGTAMPAFAMDAFDDAKQNLVAGELNSVLLAIATGAISANTQDEEGFTLLHLAAKSGSLSVVQALLERGADPTIRAKNGSTPEALATTPEVRAELAAATAQRGVQAPGAGREIAPGE